VLGVEDESPELKKSISLAAMILKEKKRRQGTDATNRCVEEKK
jgi:hypothetical protein